MGVYAYVQVIHYDMLDLMKYSMILGLTYYLHCWPPGHG